MASLTFDKDNKLIVVGIADDEITVQELVDKIRNFEDDNLEVDTIMTAGGKEELGGGVLVGITLRLIDWKVQFAARPGAAWVLCSVTGGNLVSYDTGTSSYVFPIEPSAFVSGYVQAASSATLQELDAIQYASFNNAVWLDVTNGTAGTAYPQGTPEYPVDNLADAKTVAIANGFSRIRVVGNLTLAAGDDVTAYTIEGTNSFSTTITCDAGCVTFGTAFEMCKIQGTLGGTVGINNNSRVANLANFSGSILRSSLEGTLTVTGTTDLQIIECYSGVPGTGTPVIDIDGSDCGFGLRAYSGGIEIRNFSVGGNSISVDFISGQCKLANTCTAGTIVVRGVGKLEDTSGNKITTGSWNGVTIVNETISRGTITSAIHEGTAQASTDNTVTLSASASATNGAYDPALILITAGTGVGQARGIYGYNGATKIAVVDRNWKVKPDATSSYAILAWPGREHVNEGLAQGGTANTITLNTLASSDNDAYNNQTIFLRSGTGEDQVNRITDYDGVTKIATVDNNWLVVPDATTGYVMLPTLAVAASGSGGGSSSAGGGTIVKGLWTGKEKKKLFDKIDGLQTLLKEFRKQALVILRNILKKKTLQREDLEFVTQLKERDLDMYTELLKILDIRKNASEKKVFEKLEEYIKREEAAKTAVLKKLDEFLKEPKSKVNGKANGKKKKAVVEEDDDEDDE